MALFPLPKVNMEPRSLQYIAEACGGSLSGFQGLVPASAVSKATVARVCTNSREAKHGDLFFALVGERFDAHSFVPEVSKLGVAAVVVEKTKLPEGVCGCPIIAVDNTRRALGLLAARYRRDFDLPVIAVGGSNGKTTTKELIASVLRQQK